MNWKLVCSAAAAAALNIALTMPAHAQAKAALTRDIDRSSAQPVHGICGESDASSGFLKCTLYTVPAGKRLIVETVSYEAVTAAGSVVTSVLFGQDYKGTSYLNMGFGNVFNIQPTYKYEQDGYRVYGGTQALRMYIDENNTLAAGGAHGGAYRYYGWQLSFSGYLVDK